MEIILAIIAGLWAIMIAISPFFIVHLFKRIKKNELKISDLEHRLAGSPLPLPEVSAPPAPKRIIKPDMAVAPKPRPAHPPQAENFRIHKLKIWVSSFLTGGRLFVTLGLGLLFISIAMLFNYASKHIELSIEFRFYTVIIGALGMIFFGHRQMKIRRDYGLYIQGGGLGILFLAIFSAFKVYALFSAGTAFALLTLVGAAGFGLSLYHNSMALAVLAVTGGFAAPLLASSGTGSHISLLSYYFMVNLVILAISWYKSWRVLNMIGFFFTFSLGLLWGAEFYTPQFYTSVQLFLILYFLLYTSVGILYASHIEPKLRNPVDSSSIFGVPFVAIGMQLSIVDHIPHGRPISAAIMGLFYALLYVTVKKIPRAGCQSLGHIFIGLSALFLTLALFLHFSHHTSAILFALEGAAFLWLFTRTNERFHVISGISLLFLADFLLMDSLHLQGYGKPFLNPFFLSVFVITLTHLAAGYLLKPYSSKWHLAPVFSFIAIGWWFIMGGVEINDATPAHEQAIQLYLGFFAMSAHIGYRLHRHVPQTHLPIFFVLPLIIASTFMLIMDALPMIYHPLQDYGLYTLPLAFFVHYAWLRHTKPNAYPYYHITGYIYPVFLSGLEAAIRLYGDHATDIQAISGLLFLTEGGILLLLTPKSITLWPLSILKDLYLKQTTLPLILWGFALYLYTSPRISLYGNQTYIPLINPVDLVEMIYLFTLLSFYRAFRTIPELRRLAACLGASSLFIFITAIMLRLMSSLYHMPYFSTALWDMVEVQTALSILWSVMAMIAMITASRRHIRAEWLAGAALLAVVVVKLFMIDLARVETLSRIISFMAVGGLCLGLGYVAPMPPKQKTAL